MTSIEFGAWWSRLYIRVITGELAMGVSAKKDVAVAPTVVNVPVFYGILLM